MLIGESEMVQGASTAVRPKFGWGWAGHTAIEKAGVELLSQSSFKSYLKGHMDAINQQSIDQDRFHSGANHFVNLETMVKAEYGAAQPAFAQVDQFFSTANAGKKAREFQQQPLQTSDFSHFTNVHKAISDLYRQLVSQLKAVKSAPPASETSRQGVNRSLVDTVGALAHYVGDLHQPMHTTHYYSWPLAFPGRGGSHAYLEGSLFQSRDFPNWQGRLQQKEKGKTPPTLNLAQVQELLLRQIEAGYLKVYDLVAADRTARQANPSDGPAYFSDIRRNWKDISSDRMDDAARSLSVILNSAYVEAGKPDLGPLDPHTGLRGQVKRLLGNA